MKSCTFSSTLCSLCALELTPSGKGTVRPWISPQYLRIYYIKIRTLDPSRVSILALQSALEPYAKSIDHGHKNDAYIAR